MKFSVSFISRAALSAAALYVSCHAPSALAQEDRNGQDASAAKPFVYLLDRHATFKEQAVDTLPPLPRDGDLLPFEVSQNSPLTFAIDGRSLSIGDHDHVIRYTVVITSPQGARNVRYEGIRCDTYEWRAYAATDEAGTAWDRGAATEWARIENTALNGYHAALYTDYFCASKMPVASAKVITDNIRYRRPTGP